MDTTRCAPCPECGRPATFRVLKRDGHCGKCAKKKSHVSPRLAGRGHRHTDRMHQCKMPKCRKMFRLRKDQDPKYTWYCHECRGQVAEITEGLGWLKRMGVDIEVGVEAKTEDEVLELIEEVKHETVLSQDDPAIDGPEGGGLPAETKRKRGRPRKLTPVL